jgi:hypothetical protein
MVITTPKNVNAIKAFLPDRNPLKRLRSFPIYNFEILLKTKRSLLVNSYLKFTGELILG